MRYFDCVVIGAGAAGLMCAATAGQRGRSLLVLDHANKVGKKILMSGGGRCNFTNYSVEASNYLSANPHFCISALRRYTPWNFIELVNRHGLAYHEKSQGQLFCDHRSRDILDILLAECERGKVRIETRCAVHAIRALEPEDGQSDSPRFELETANGPVACHSLVVATGGLSIPTLGASGFGYQIAEQFGLQVTERAAALVPFVLEDEWKARASSLAGVALPVTVTCNGQAFSDALLFTHKGLSGPAILQISNYWTAGDPITVDFLPGVVLGEQIREWQQRGEKASLKTLLARLLPKRFVTTWLALPELAELAEKPLAELKRQERQILEQCFQCWQIVPPATEGYRTAEVTRGGVCVDEVSSKTFEAKRVPGLFFVGEVLDVTGWLGGYNFQWAWASGHCAAQYV